MAVRDKTCKQFPRNLENYFPNLEMIVMEGANLMAIQKFNLQPFAKLRFLYLPRNSITTLENNLFEANINLEIINIDSNRIKAIGFQVLKPLTNLKQISLLNNGCINDTALNSTALESFKIQLVMKCSPPYVHVLMAKISNLEKRIDEQNHEQKAENSRISSLKGKIDETTAAEKSLSKRFFELKSSFDQLIANLTKNAYATAL
jgi:hypothetical protein